MSKPVSISLIAFIANYIAMATMQYVTTSTQALAQNLSYVAIFANSIIAFFAAMAALTFFEHLVGGRILHSVCFGILWVVAFVAHLAIYLALMHFFGPWAVLVTTVAIVVLCVMTFNDLGQTGQQS